MQDHVRETPEKELKTKWQKGNCKHPFALHPEMRASRNDGRKRLHIIRDVW